MASTSMVTLSVTVEKLACGWEDVLQLNRHILDFWIIWWVQISPAFPEVSSKKKLF